MKKNLLAIGLLAIGYSVQAQTETVLLHVDDAAKMYVSEGTLVYNGGGLQTRNTGNIELHGNMMVVGSAATDALRTIDGTGADKTTGANIVLKLNTPSSTGSAFATSTYGQLYITGMAQSRVRAIVDKEYKDITHGSFQQMALPFSNKTVQSIATDLGRLSNFTNNRTTSALAYWDNTNTVMRVVNPSTSTDPGNNTALYGPTTYFAVGTNGWTPAPAGTDVRTVKGVPYADAAAGTNAVVLINGGKPGGNAIQYGSSGQNLNAFNERYYSYLNDPFDLKWSTNYGKELYQFGNPFLTNIDLSWIGTESEGGGTTDGNRLPIKGIRYSQIGVNYSSTVGTTTTTNNTITFLNNSNGAIPPGTPAGDVNNLVIKPMGAVYIKLDVDLAANTSLYDRSLNFNTLRRFSKTARTSGTGYNVTAAKNGNATLKQLGVIALDSDDKEISRTYYVVHGDATTGYTTSPNLQANLGYSGNSSSTPINGAIYTNEEYITGGADPTYASQYNLYINEANEVNFLHKRIPMKLNSNAISKLKFEIRENAVLIPNNQSALSAGESFWIKLNGNNVMISQNQVIDAASQVEAGLYYGEPAVENVLGTSENIKKSGTIVAYEKATDNFVVIFDKGWKTADIVIYDMSGKLINSEKKVNTTSNHTLSIPRNLNNGYLITIKSDSGEVYNTKIMR